MASHIRSLCFAGVLAVAGTVNAGSLIECPDCDQPVSYRALLCPHCGCPGDAIKAAAAALKAEAEGPAALPLAQLTSDHGQGFAVAVADGEKRFLVMDMMLIADSSSLTITPLTTNTPLAYWNMQVADREPLVRFETDSTNLLFMVQSKQPSGFRLMPDGSVEKITRDAVQGQNAVAAVDATTNIIAFVSGGGQRMIPVGGVTWKDVKPAPFRQQLALLKEATKALGLGKDDPEIAGRLEETKWLSAYLAEQARGLVMKMRREIP